MNIRSISHRILRGVLGMTGLALVLPACASDRLAEPPPHESGFTGSTTDDADPVTHWTAPASGRARIWTVVRDGRGGSDHRWFDVEVAP